MQKNIQLQHDEVDSNSDTIQPEKTSSKIKSNTDLKIGRNDKIELISPSGEKVKIKFKKIDQYLMKGFSRVEN